MEAVVPPRPLTVGGSLGCGAPRPPLRQAAGRYVQYALLLCYTEKHFASMQMIDILHPDKT